MEGLKRYWPLLLIALGLIGGIMWWQDKRAEERRVEEQLAQAQGIVRVLSATFSNKAALKVGEINGTLDVTVVDPGAVPILRSSQKATVPYSVGYTLNLSDVGADDYRWEPAARTLTIRVPTVTAEAPNVDEANRAVAGTSGIFVTRGASANLARRASQLATAKAGEVAAEPANLAKAQQNAEKVVADLARTPLEAAGLGPITVRVITPAAGVRDGERWDVSRSIEQVLADRPR
ncbi:hypothetical protein GGQ97_001199 [Sphingomonas kaistensis]|uniref:DUF4230 domain-containing protein n=1 Tax=Sphingomonas kaistensis TaxID=298708 RepID=A0A7X6BGT4_9SPHN|nr:DUF4230 domain-containing protein [Sphingomonas kaistensis]NJC05406.1 hypothetical protein [Sphingomonas kaistensis]